VDSVHFCYIDESGVSSIPGNTSHFVLAGISIPVLLWSKADGAITAVLKKYGLEHEELHTAWLLRPYLEQLKIPNFEKLNWKDRRSAVERERTKELLRLQQAGQSKPYQQAKKNYKHSKPYIHLTRDERKVLVGDVAKMVAKWDYAKLFAECIDKIFFDPSKAKQSVDEQAFEQVISRFEQYLVNTSPKNGPKNYGLIVHDNNETIARKHTTLMRHFQREGTFFTEIKRIVETPLFVDSSLTRMVQVADLCSYALRRYLENNEEELFEQIYNRADRVGKRVLGVRHFTDPNCSCLICESHKAKH
jgi:hypothetical protein